MILMVFTRKNGGFSMGELLVYRRVICFIAHVEASWVFGWGTGKDERWVVLFCSLLISMFGIKAARW